MTFILKAARKVIRVPFRLLEYLEMRRKQGECLAGPGTFLHDFSRIANLQGRRDAITIGSGSQILGELCIYPHGGAIRIGDDCFIGEQSRIWSANSIVIGNRVLISHGVNIHDYPSHSLSAELRHNHFKEMVVSGHPAILKDVPSAPIVIEDDAWIGFHAVIFQGVRIGRGAVVSAGSVVARDVPDYAMVAGSPARLIGEARP